MSTQYTYLSKNYNEAQKESEKIQNRKCERRIE